MTKDKVICKTVIVDDDEKSRILLIKLLRKHSQVKIVGEADSVSSALKVIKDTEPDSIFLDVKLENETGFNLLDKLSSNLKVIFVTANSDFAMQAFDVNALDFVKKPIEKDKLGRAVNRLIDDLALSSDEILKSFDEKNKSYEDRNENSMNDVRKKTSTKKKIKPDKLEYDDRLFLTKNGSSKFIKVNSILSITANKDYSYIHSLDENKIIILRTMKEWEQRLPEKYFARIHRSTIVNLEYIEKVEKWFNYAFHVYVKGIDTPYQMSRRYASKLREKFK
ncbi:MAG TPA: response regulator transcription factor [Ignavibacteria bacterium]|nr:response regulator transcription factor [Ignavibacteria bacterium]